MTTTFPTNNLGELTWYIGCAFKRNCELGALEITQKAFVESMLNSFGVNSSSDLPTTLTLNEVQERRASLRETD